MASKNIEYKGKTYTVSYEIFNPKKEKIILFLHGWGANKELMKKAFSKGLDDFRLIFLDLPGFGKSNIHEPMDSYEYVDILKLFINSLRAEIYCMVGHSFGGKLATLLKPQNLVLLSSAGIVKKKSFKVKAKIRAFKLFKALGLGRFYKLFATKDVEGMSKIMYETLKKVVDEDMSEEFASYEGRAFIFWGKNDEATPLSSGKKIHSLIKGSEFCSVDGDHFFFLKHSDFITKTIKERLC